MAGWDDISVAVKSQLVSEGYDEKDVAPFVSSLAPQIRKQLSDEGYGETELDSFFGIKQPDLKPIQRELLRNIAKAPKPVESWTEAIEAGWQVSVSGLLARRESPSRVLPADAGLLHRFLAGGTTIMGDAPAMLAGIVGGGAAGQAAIPAPVVGGVIGSAAGGFALPAGLRKLLMDHYEKGDIQSFGELWSRGNAALWEAAKGGAIGAATGGAGLVIRGALGPTAAMVAAATEEGASPAVVSALTRTVRMAGAAGLAGEIATMTSVGAAMEGHVPKAQDFVDAALLVGAFHGGMKVASKMRGWYAKTGTPPAKQAEIAVEDPVTRQELVSDDVDVPTAAKRIEKLQQEARESTEESEGPMVIDENTPAPSASEAPRYKPGDVVSEQRPGDIIEGLVDELGRTDPEESFAGEPVTVEVKTEAPAVRRPQAVAGEIPETHRKAVDSWHSSGGSDPDVEAVFYKIDRDQISEILDGIATGDVERFTPAELDAVSKVMRLPEGKDFDAWANAWSSARKPPARPPAVPAEGAELPSGSDAVEAVKARISKDPDAIPAKTWRQTYRDVMDRYTFLKDVSEKAYKYARVFSGVIGRAERVYRFETFDGSTHRSTGEGVKIILDAWTETGKSLDDFQVALVAPRVLELQNRVQKETGNTRPSPGDRVRVKDDKGDFYEARIESVLSDSVVVKAPKRGDFRERLNQEMSPEEAVAVEAGQGEIPTTFTVPMTDALRTWITTVPVVNKAGKVVGERTVRNIWKGIDPAVAKAAMDSFSPQEKAIVKRWQALRDRMLQYLVDGGIVEPKKADLFRRLSDDYVELYTVLEDPAVGGGPRRTSGDAYQPIRQMFGSEERIIDPLESRLKDIMLFVTLVEKNRIWGELLAARPDLFEDVTSTTKPVKVTAEEVGRWLVDHGYEESAADVTDALTVWRNVARNKTKGMVTILQQGKARNYRILDPEIELAAAHLDGQSVGLVTKILAMPATLLRDTVVTMPDYALRNLFRDQFSMWIQSENGYVPFYDAWRGFWEIWGEGKLFREALSSQMFHNTSHGMGRNYFQQRLAKLTQEAGLMTAAYNVVRHPIEALRVLSELGEKSTRMGEYMRAREKGKSPLDAAYSAREGTLDFDRHGAQTKALNMIVAFWNAGPQGWDRMVRAGIDRPWETAVKAVAGITAPSLLLWWVNKDDPRWRELPSWQKDLFWIVFTDKWEEATEADATRRPEGMWRRSGDKYYVNNGHTFRIPKPFELGVLFGSMAERLADVAVGQDPKAVDRMLKTMLEAVPKGVSPYSYVPTAAIPVLEQWSNKVIFTGNPLVPSYAEGWLPEYRYSEYTSETAKALGKLVAQVPGLNQQSFASPAVMENYVRAWTGNLGFYALQIADKALEVSGVRPTPPPPAATMADWPVVRAFVVRHPTANTDSIQSFYDRYEKSRQRIATIRGLANRSEIQESLNVLNRPDTLKYLEKLDAYKEAITQHHKELNMIRLNPDFSSQDKRQLMDGVYYAMISMAQSGNQIFDQLDRGVR